MAFDRGLDKPAGSRLLEEIKLVKTSSHEASVTLNKAVLHLRQKHLPEATKELEAARNYARDEGGVRDERYDLLAIYPSLQYLPRSRCG